MSPNPEPNPETRTPLFSVVGPAFVPEQRADPGHPVHPPEMLPPTPLTGKY